MNVAYHCSDACSQMLGVSITSLFETNKATEEITVYVIEKEICEKNKSLLLELAKKYKRKIVFIPMPDINLQVNLGLIKVKEKWHFDSYCRIFLDKILPDYVERVLYLDCDVIVTDDIQTLWNLDLEGCCAAGVLDCLSEQYYKLFGLSDDSAYCNSGVILFDLKQWKQNKMDDHIKKYIAQRNGYIFFMEQSVLNGVMEGKWLVLGARYNVSTLMMSLSYQNLIKLRRPKAFYDCIEYNQAVINPAIIHMTSNFLVNNRAWVVGSNHPAKEYYFKYKQFSPWKNTEDIPDRRTILQKLLEIIVKVVPNFILFPLVEIIYNRIRILQIKKSMKKYGGMSNA